jgi:YbbR domain-containing protein
VILRLITDEWRLKLLALVLAALMLVAVAAAQTKPTTKTLTVGLTYTVPENIILLNPPTKTTVTFSGLADPVSRVDPSSNLFATADATGAKPGSAVKLNVTARTTVRDVTVQNPPPIVANIDTLQQVDLPVQVVAHAQTGWSIDPSKTLATCPGAANPRPCKVRFNGPVSWENGLKAAVTVKDAVVGRNDIPNQTIQLQPASGVDLSQRTLPSIRQDVAAADVHIEAVAGTSTESVALIDSQPTHPPPAGYRVTRVLINPLLVTITGDPAVLLKIQNLSLPPVDLSRSTADVTFQVAIPYPNGVTGSVANATVKYFISPNPNASPSP